MFLSDSKQTLHRVRKVITAELKNRYKLKLKDNWRIAPSATGIDFVGFVHFPEHTKVRKSVKISYKKVASAIINRLKRHIPLDRHIMGALISYDGMIRWADGRRLSFLNMGRVNTAIEFGVEAI